jgi:hypothetical protein
MHRLHFSVTAIIFAAVLLSITNAQTITGYGSSWMGFQAPDQCVMAGTGLIPLATFDCPADPDIQGGWKVFDNSSGTSNDALLFDWTHNYGGWHAANIAGTNWAPIQAPVTDANCKLVFWIKGEAGGEEGAFTLNIAFTNNVTATAIWPPGVPAVTTSWRKITIPLSSFAVPAGATGVVSIQTGNSHAAMHAKYYIDNVYFTTGSASVKMLPYHSYQKVDGISATQPYNFSTYDLAGRAMLLPFHQNINRLISGMYVITNDKISPIPVLK